MGIPPPPRLWGHAYCRWLCRGHRGRRVPLVRRLRMGSLLPGCWGAEPRGWLLVHHYRSLLTSPSLSPPAAASPRLILPTDRRESSTRSGVVDSSAAIAEASPTPLATALRTGASAQATVEQTIAADERQSPRPRGSPLLLQWRYAPTGAAALNQPSLAEPLPNGDILANDDKNNRVIVIDPRTNKIVWQYGHTHVAGAGEGFLSDPDGVDLAPPYSLAARFAGKSRAP